MSTTSGKVALLLLALCASTLVQGAKNDSFVRIAAVGAWSIPPFRAMLNFAKFGAYLINNNDHLFPDIFPGLLPDTTLIIDSYDVGLTDPGLASILAVDAAQRGMLAFLGGPRTAQQEQVVYVADSLMIPYVGGVVSGAVFSSKALYPYFMRTSETDQFMALVMVEFIVENGWENVAIIYSNDDFGVGNYNYFLNYSMNVNLTVFGIEIVSGGNNFVQEVQQLKDSQHRVIVLMTEYTEGFNFLSNASTLGGLVGPEYAWLLDQVFIQTFESSTPPPTVNASLLVQGAITFYPNADGGEVAQSVLNYWGPANPTLWPTPGTNVWPSRLVPDADSWFLMDGVVTLAKGLEQYLTSGGIMNTVNGNLTANGTTLYNIMRNLNFDGVSGNVRFDGDADRIGKYNVVSYHKGGLTSNLSLVYSPAPASNFTFVSDITYYDLTTTRPRDLPCRCVHGVCIGYSQVCICEPNWLLDDCSKKNNFETHSDALSGALGTVVGASVIVALFAFVVLVFRTEAFAGKSPMFCAVIILGTIISYASALTLLPEPTDNLCMAFPWLLGVGFTFVYGCLFLKTWRVYRVIDSSMKCERLVITNFYIGKLVGAALIIEVIFMIIWTATNPLKAQVRSFQDDHTRLQCKGSHQVAFWAVFAGYKFLWMIFGAVMAVRTRNYYDQYNDSKAIALSIYNTITMLILGVPIAVVLADFPYVLIVVEVALIVIVFNFTLVSMFMLTWIEVFFGRAELLPELKSVPPKGNSSTTMGGGSSGSGSKNSKGSKGSKGSGSGSGSGSGEGSHSGESVKTPRGGEVEL